LATVESRRHFLRKTLANACAFDGWCLFDGATPIKPSTVLMAFGHFACDRFRKIETQNCPRSKPGEWTPADGIRRYLGRPVADRERCPQFTGVGRCLARDGSESSRPILSCPQVLRIRWAAKADFVHGKLSPQSLPHFGHPGPDNQRW